MIPAPVIRTYPLPPVNRKEVFRYLGVNGAAPGAQELLDSCMEECKDVFEGKICYTSVKIRTDGQTVDFGFSSVESASLSKALQGCGSAVLFAATVGIGIDRLIRRYSALSPSRAVCLQALGAERIEALCDLFGAEIAHTYAENGEQTRPRFSPGYGDLPLSFQTELFRLLDCPKHIGLSLGRSLLMSPSKSVTAIIGITEGQS